MTERDAESGRLRLPVPAITGDRDQGGAETRASFIQQAIRRAVLEQRLAPGTRLPEDQIGGLFGASRTLVRAALQRLMHDGIVTMSRNRGAFVASPSVEEARQVFEARRIIETVTVTRAAELIGPAELDGLQELLGRALQAVADGDRGTAIRLSGEFHLSIGACARQDVLQGFLVELVSRSSLVIALYGRGYDSACADDEHRALTAALRNRDAAAAARLMASHLDHIEADLDLKPRHTRAVSLAEALSLADGALS